jgi:hypothetical protein
MSILMCIGLWDRWNKAVTGEFIEKIEPKQI